MYFLDFNMPLLWQGTKNPKKFLQSAIFVYLKKQHTTILMKIDLRPPVLLKTVILKTCFQNFQASIPQATLSLIQQSLKKLVFKISLTEYRTTSHKITSTYIPRQVLKRNCTIFSLIKIAMKYYTEQQLQCYYLSFQTGHS